jgi:hypothetical protein
MKLLKIGERYEKDGQQKTSWKTIGELFVANNGKEYVKLYHIPNTLVSVFEKEATPSKNAPASNSELAPDEDVAF